MGEEKDEKDGFRISEEGHLDLYKSMKDRLERDLDREKDRDKTEGFRIIGDGCLRDPMEDEDERHNREKEKRYEREKDRDKTDDYGRPLQKGRYRIAHPFVGEE